MPKMPTAFQAALATICALGDEAQYERTPRHAGLNKEAMAIIDTFPTSAERCALVIAFMDSYDMAEARMNEGAAWAMAA